VPIFVYVSVSGQENVDLAYGHAAFAGLTQSDPLKFTSSEEDASAFIAPFHMPTAASSLEKNGEYMCGINLAWIDPFFAPCPKVPIAWASVQTIYDTYFKSGKGFGKDLALEVPILECEVSTNFMAERGTLKHVSPDEIIMAFFMAVAENIRNGVSEDILQNWIYHFQSAPCMFVKVPRKEDIEWRGGPVSPRFGFSGDEGDGG